jgi:3-mercaptopyruvate sulfurtransferase SseA
MKRKKRTQPQNSFPAWIFIAGGALLVVAIVLLAVRPGAQPQAQTPADNANIPYPEIERVTLADSKAALEAGTAVIVDVRSAEAYAASHIAGALSLPINEIDARQTELDPAAWIITYCT